MKKLATFIMLFFIAIFSCGKDLKINYSIYNDLSDSDKARYLNSLQSEGDFSEYIARHPYSNLDIYFEKEYNSRSSSEKIFVIIDKIYYENADYTEKLDRFALDLAYQGYNSSIYVINAGNPTDLRNFIIANSSNLKGVTFIGDIAAAWYEHENDINWHVHAEWVSDLFYGDLNGSYSDSDGDGILDVFSGDIAPEIWISRFSPSTVMDDPYKEGLLYQKQQFIRYLDNTHKYFRGLLFYGNKAANMIGEDWDDSINVLNRFNNLYESNVDLYIDNNHNANTLFYTLHNSNYGAFYIDAHSDFKTQDYNYGRTLWSIEILAGRAVIDDYANIFYFNIEPSLIGLGACSASNFTALQGNNPSFGIAYLFSYKGKVQSVYGMTKTGNNDNDYMVYNNLSNNYYLGDAFIKWYRDIYNAYLPYSSWHYKEYWMSYNGGSILLGNPLLKVNYSLSFYTPNYAPLLSINNSSYSVLESNKLEIDLPATDYDGDILSYSLGTSIPNLSIVGNKLTWTPSYTQGGITYSILLIVNDGIETAVNTINIKVINLKRI